MPRRRSGHDRKPTIVDVAKRAGVSLGTASNVLNDKKRVDAQLRRRVWAAVAALGYQPNTLAQSLRRRRSRVVGLCVPYTTSAYFAALMESFEALGAGLGYEVMQVLSRQDPELEYRRVSALLAHQVAGLILLPSIEPSRTLNLIAASGVPAVVVDRLSDDRRFDYVTIDDRGAMREATQHLLDLGHRRLLFVVTYPQLVTTRERIAGLRQAVRVTAGATADVLERGPDEEHFAARLTEILRSPERPTALIASNSTIMLWTLKTLRLSGVRCPQDLSLLVFDEPEWSEITTPRLALVRHPTATIAHTAWELLIRRLADGGPPQRIRLTAALVPSDSIAPPAPRPRS